MATETKSIQVHLPPDLHKKLRQTALDSGKTIKGLLMDWIKSLPKKRAA